MLTATKEYLGLIKKFPLRPIETDAELDQAVAVVDSLLAKPKLSKDADDYLDVLGDLVRKYETAAHPIGPATDAEMLKHLMESRDVSQTGLHKATGIAISTISEILSGKRRLARRHIAALSAFFRVSADSFAAPAASGAKEKSGKKRRSAPLAASVGAKRPKPVKRRSAARRGRG
jgi:HTH-type transcriptional regulator/antitoxin HigA